jgi:isopenicillin-N epimerase
MHRREVLKSTAAAAAVLGLDLSAPEAAQAATAPAPPLPPVSLLAADPEKYWKRIRDEQFLLPDWRIFLNNGSLGLTPRPVLQAVAAYLEESAALTTDDYHRWGYETLDDHRAEMAAFIGCGKDELAFMHNATEAMSTIAAGLDLKAGDEVLLTDQEHPGGRGCWYQKARRFGTTVREVKLPLPPTGPEQLADVVVSAIGPRTRVLSFSGITTNTGLIMPVAAIAAAARAKGVLTVVDGAHMAGQIPVNLHAMGCDFWAGSPHKWLFAPAGSGLLYVREENLNRLWATTVTGNWDDASLKAAKFMMVGTNNRAVFEGMRAGLRFARALGVERIYARTHQLARQVRAHAARLPYLDLLTPDDDRMFGSLATFAFQSGLPKEFYQACGKRRIWVYGGEWLRISTHIHTRPQDLDTLFELIEREVGSRATAAKGARKG